LIFNCKQMWVGTVRCVGTRSCRKSEMAQNSEIGNQNFFRKSEGKNVGNWNSDPPLIVSSIGTSLQN